MRNPFTVIETIEDFRSALESWRKNNLTIGFVPTMGALHLGHLSLIERSIATNDRTCVSIFVNPSQFDPNEDLQTYPRTKIQDEKVLGGVGIDLLFSPTNDEMYSAEDSTIVSVKGIGDILEGEFRPNFFAGVATVVSKLLIASLPDRAYFGEKDYQQLCIINRIIKDLNIPVEIIGCPTIREKDVLAFSSRNIYLSKKQRVSAASLYLALNTVKGSLESYGSIEDALSAGRQVLRENGFKSIDYLTIRDASGLGKLERLDQPARIMGAAWLGNVRLIDNIAL